MPSSQPGREFPVQIYIQKGIRREGAREQLRLNPVEFETEGEVLRISEPGGNQVLLRSLLAEWYILNCAEESNMEIQLRIAL